MHPHSREERGEREPVQNVNVRFAIPYHLSSLFFFFKPPSKMCCARKQTPARPSILIVNTSAPPNTSPAVVGGPRSARAGCTAGSTALRCVRINNTRGERRKKRVAAARCSLGDVSRATACCCFASHALVNLLIMHVLCCACSRPTESALCASGVCMYACVCV